MTVTIFTPMKIADGPIKKLIVLCVGKRLGETVEVTHSQEKTKVQDVSWVKHLSMSEHIMYGVWPGLQNSGRFKENIFKPK